MSIQAAGGKNIAVSLAFPGMVVSDGQLRIDFVNVKDQAKISAMEVTSVAIP